ncbi:acyltransferase [Aeromonas caviae]|uniref:acyltransferase family protein n=1 Tax=Aeromonas caviae TaxID=648 RepID=UPI002449BCF4|nr:acyltransferase [Aeromonas caviae]MDH0435520.1 acyltransferase [Aeromonas caviae]MDH0938365.1 acyltransferase [Aeromonas caviae]MDH1399198.1 acyltransferase [Aeromonas caviae]MDH1850029.1 acyltransferase [Aeromonas caviae]
MLRSIHYLRGLAALFVVFYHTRDSLAFPIGPIPNLGDFLFAQAYLGVDLFFIISGFVIVLSTQKDKSLLSFISKRFFRIYPLYAFCLISVLMLSQQEYSLNQILRSFLIIHANYSEAAPWFGYSILFVAWTISYEILFYAIFCAAMSFSHKYRIAISSMFIVATITIINFFCKGTASLDGYYALQNDYGVLRFLSSPMQYEFIAGMVIAYIYIHKDKLGFIRSWYPALSSIGIMYFILFYFGYCNGFGHGLSNAGLAAFMLVFSLLLIDIFSDIRESKALTILGDVSYSLYMNQVVIFALYPIAFATVAVNSVSVMIVKVSLIVTLSIVTYYYIEKPSIIAARKIISLISNKRNSVMTVADLSINSIGNSK